MYNKNTILSHTMTTTRTTTRTTRRRFTSLVAAAIVAVASNVPAVAAAKTPTTTTTISYDFPTVHGTIFKHAFCVRNAVGATVTVRSTMPSELSYAVRSSTHFNSNTKLFGDNDDLTPAKRSIRDTNQCRGGIYVQPSHETLSGTSYDGSRFGLDVVVANHNNNNVTVTLCAMVPDPSWGSQLAGGWDVALRARGFTQGSFRDNSPNNERVWEVHCKDIDIAAHDAAAAAAATQPVIPFPSVTVTHQREAAAIPHSSSTTSSVEEQKMLRRQRIRMRNTNKLPATTEAPVVTAPVTAPKEEQQPPPPQEVEQKKKQQRLRTRNGLPLRPGSSTTRNGVPLRPKPSTTTNEVADAAAAKPALVERFRRSFLF